MTVRVVTDSASDLPPDLARELDIIVVPATVRFGTEVFKDGVELQTEEFFERLLTGPDYPTTSQPTVGDFMETYRSLAEGADGIVSVHVSGKLSGTLNSARQGAEQADLDCPVEALDSRQASMATGLVAVACARAAQSGASMSEITETANNAIERSNCIALLDTLEYLEKGGRIGKAQAILGSLLRIKPMITIQDGEVHPYAKERTRRKAVARLERATTDLAPIDALAVMYSTERAEAVLLAEAARPLVADGGDVMVARFGPALGTYVGPNALGITALAAER